MSLIMHFIGKVREVRCGNILTSVKNTITHCPLWKRRFREERMRNKFEESKQGNYVTEEVSCSCFCADERCLFIEPVGMKTDRKLGVVCPVNALMLL